MKAYRIRIAEQARIKREQESLVPKAEETNYSQKTDRSTPKKERMFDREAVPERTDE